MNKLFLVTASFLILITIQLVSAQDCVPNYICGEWSPCDGGFMTRVCTDTECNNPSKQDRTVCSSPRCTPQIECGEWGPCEYEGKTTDLLNGEVLFPGKKKRTCDDKKNCIANYIQEENCEDSYKLQLSPVTECGQNLLVAKDRSSDYTIARIDLDRWKTGKFDLSFVQGDRKYCPSCYNAVKDGNEEKIDCGGDCKPCKTEQAYLIQIGVFTLWAGSLTFVFLSFRQFLMLRKTDEVYIKEK